MKLEPISFLQILEPQETLDDIVNDPLDEDNLNDLSDEGIDNPAFYPEGSFEVEEKYDISDESRLNREKTEKHKIKPDESIQILPFSDIQTRYRSKMPCYIIILPLRLPLKGMKIS